MDKALQHYYLETMGIQRWQSKSQRIDSVTVPEVTVRCAPLISSDWESLSLQVAACQACGLHKTRTQTVFGVGNQKADVMFVGEAPGANEDRLGFPFVGRAGQLLDAMLKAIGLDRNQVYIANILKCRPPNNRDPQAEEVEQCTPFLQKQIELLQPKLMVALGRIASHFLLKTTASLSSLRGKEFFYGETKTPLIVTYHPAYLLRAPRDKRKAYQDLALIVDHLKRT